MVITRDAPNSPYRTASHLPFIRHKDYTWVSKPLREFPKVSVSVYTNRNSTRNLNLYRNSKPIPISRNQNCPIKFLPRAPIIILSSYWQCNKIKLVMKTNNKFRAYFGFGSGFGNRKNKCISETLFRIYRNRKSFGKFRFRYPCLEWTRDS
jgi:hypothetical protein